ncbi:GNAT family N-acetyltransferase [Streptomyces sp. NPDC055254]
MSKTRGAVRLTPWGPEDFWLLRRKNSAEMTRFLGGPESEEKLADRQRRYEALSAREPAAGRMFRVDLVAPGGSRDAVGTIGFWEREWRGEPVYESGWAVLPEFRGQRLAAAALTELLAHLGEHGTRGAVHAFPRTDHAASNAVCRRAGFTCLGRVDLEYPPGVPHPSHDWHHPLPRPLP